MPAGRVPATAKSFNFYFHDRGLSRAWLKYSRYLSIEQWLTEPQQMQPQLEHYHYRVLAKRAGSVRLIEVPKPLLKDMHRTILIRILEKIPPHPAAHGFLKGRSIKTFIAPMCAGASSCAWTCKISLPQSPAQEFRHYSAPWDIPNR
jgi:hypothetical protein